MTILVLNAGSSSLKFAIFHANAAGGMQERLRGQVAGIGTKARFEASGTAACDLPQVGSLHEAEQFAVGWLAARGHDPRQASGIGHRIVHGGTNYVQPVLVDDNVEEQLGRLSSLAPLHLPFGLGVLARMRAIAPDVPQIACFDTAFHASQPEVAVRLPLPRSYHERGYRRYGFHGLNYEHVVAALPGLSGRSLPRRLLAAHLGNGASMCAIADGRSIATTMGYSTADGLVMGTRTGAIDPGVLIALMRDDGLDLQALEDLLYRRSGLLGLSGISSDMRALLASKEADARLAVDNYCYWAARHAASLISVLGGIDGLVFTGGVGEHAAPVREKIVRHLGWLGLRLESKSNAANGVKISEPGAKCSIYIVPADEELAIARHVHELLG